MVLSVVVGGAVGLGAWFLAAGLLPTFRPIEVGSAGHDLTTGDDDTMIVRAVLLDPHVLAERRRTQTALGIGCLAGGVVALGVFVRSARWCPRAHRT